ncbi:hypothetical protein KC356_g5942 [Hortaea werneckii]|nr:hypothetical protein KC356_g5942 [Hortaea werneckii]
MVPAHRLISVFDPFSTRLLRLQSSRKQRLSLLHIPDAKTRPLPPSSNNISNRAKTPDTTKGVVTATRIGSRLLSPYGTPHEHTTNALNPQPAYGTAASQFWFELQSHLIESLVRSNGIYTFDHPASQRDLRALVCHPTIRTKEMLLFAYRKRDELNIFNEEHQLPSSNQPPLSPSATPHFQHMNFHLTLQTPHSPETLCGFDLLRALRIPQRFPNLKSVVINLDIHPGSKDRALPCASSPRRLSSS